MGDGGIDRWRTEGNMLYSGMAIVEQKAYQDLYSAVVDAKKDKVNLLVVTLPSTGMKRMMKEMTARGVDGLYCWDWSNEAEMLRKLTKLFDELPIDKTIVMSVNYPKVLKNGNNIWGHFLRRYYFGVRSKADSFLMMDELKADLDEKQKEEIYRQSGGLAHLIKYLVAGGDKEVLESLVEPLMEAVKGSDEEVRQKLIGKGGLGTLVEDFVRVNTRQWDIEVGFDLRFYECGKKARNRLSKVEAEILNKMMVSNGEITKEEVSDIKWGEGKYDEYSDQAINKAIRRLDEKLKKHTITTVPKIGFVLEERR